MIKACRYVLNSLHKKYYKTNLQSNTCNQETCRQNKKKLLTNIQTIYHLTILAILMA